LSFIVYSLTVTCVVSNELIIGEGWFTPFFLRGFFLLSSA